MGENTFLPGTQLPEKVRLLYRAVVELIDQGADVSELKVSDITGRAGIGKGTAYDYFKTKEEIIIKGMLYDFAERICALAEGLDREDSLKGSVSLVFDWMEKNYAGRRSVGQLLRLKLNSQEFCTGIQKETKKYMEAGGKDFIEAAVTKVAQKAKQEGKTSYDSSSYEAHTALMTGVVQYALYLNAPGKKKERADRERARNFAWRTIVKLLEA